ncbi:Krueppel-like factor luna isoform X1 [Folsomia candida]|uniref:Krueppel-like factor luna isoform X1 n=1 Tax=Folsomia candida TaxID=158441 RepID=UPI0016053618|nr:Krueppel-like factor luna isoform X1 [Folsomia candida]
MEEFRSNFLLLLHCRYPQGMLLDKVEEEYERYFQKRVEPYMFLNENPGSWRSVIEKTYLHNDLKVFEINSTLYVKPVGIRSETEMMLIAKLAKYSHFHFAQDTFFQLRDCTCCAQTQQQQIYSGFPSSAINHYSSSSSNALSTAAAVAAASNQYTANVLQQQQQAQGAEPFRVQYVTQGALQGATPIQATNLTATNLSMNGAVKYERFDDQTIRSAGQQSGDYYIMLQGSQNQPIRYDAIGNLASPTAVQAHTRQEIGSTGVVYTTTTPQQQSSTQQWSFNRETGVTQPQVASASATPSPAASTPKGRGKGKGKGGGGGGKGKGGATAVTVAVAGAVPVVNAKGKKSESSSTNDKEKQLNYCRWEGCKKAFRRYKLLENHERLAHLQDGDDNLTCSTVGCKLRFQDKKQLQHHESRCELKPHRCTWEACDKTFRTSKLLHGHISAVHRRIGRNTYKCTIPGCSQAYPDSTKLRTHEIRCQFRFDTLRDIDMEKEAADQLALAASTNSVDASGNTISSASNLTTSSISSGGGATNDDPMNMTMSSSIEETKPSTVDLSSFLKTEVDGDGQCFVQNQI